MKYKKLLFIPALSIILCGCTCDLNLYTPNDTNQNTTTIDGDVSVINDSNYTGEINYAPLIQQKLTKEEVYAKGVTSTVYVMASITNGYSLGSGVFFSEDKEDTGYAYIFTNAHVVNGAKSIDIVYSNYKRDSAKIVGYHQLEDVAVLAVRKNNNYKIATLQTSDKLKIGSEVLTIGTPIGTDYSFAATSGIISKINSPLTSSLDDSYNLLLLQIDATLNSGNSGGPLFDMYGNLIGLNTMKILYDDNMNAVDNFNFSIPIDRAVFIANHIFNKTAYQRGSIGISILDIIDLTLAQRQSYSINLNYGIYVVEVSANNGLMAGDIITKINGINITSKINFEKELYRHNKGESISLSVNRNGIESTINVTLK